MAYLSPNKVWFSADKSVYAEYDTATSRLHFYMAGSSTATFSLEGAKLGFFGTTPAAQQTMTQTAVTAIGTTTISQVATSGKWAFASSTAANALVTRVDQMQVDLETLLGKLETLGLVSVAGN